MPPPTSVWGRAAHLGAPLLVTGAIAGIVSAQGGYFPTSWGWSAMTSLWAVAIWLALGSAVNISRIDLILVGSLLSLAAWIAISTIWSTNPSMTVLEVERVLVLVGGCVAFLLVACRSTVTRLMLAIFAAITLVSTYGLATRLFPLRFGLYESDGIYRLSAPIGYWNGLGIFAVLGIVLAVGFVSDGHMSAGTRSLTAASLVVLPVTVYFTFSRGSWVSLVFGLTVALATTPRRLRLLATTAVLVPAPAIAVLLASRSTALTHANPSIAMAAHDGRRLALTLLFLAAVEVACVLVFNVVSMKVSVPTSARRAVGTVAIVVATAVAIAGLVRAGGPVHTIERGYQAFVAPPTDNQPNLNARLLDLSGNGRGDLWRYAWHLYTAHPLLGSGAGTFERAWQLNPVARQKVRDAHGLYIETLAELGPIGLAVLVVVLGIPLVAGFRSRRKPLIPTATGAYCAILLHAAVDWDWELAGVMLTGLLIGCTMIVATRRNRPRVPSGPARAFGATAAVALGGFAAFALLGNIPLGRATRDVTAGRFAQAYDEAVQAGRWQPWSPQPLIARGEAELGLGQDARAAQSFRHAIAIDSRESRSWLGFALATRGRTRAAALARAKALYPTSPDVQDAESAFAQAKSAK